MKPWTQSRDLPVQNPAFADMELRGALRCALEALFEQYPPHLQTPFECYCDELRQIRPADGREPVRWRGAALRYADKGELTEALVMADNTGVPQEELIALAMLLLPARKDAE